MIKEIARVISRLLLSVILYSIWLIVYRMKIVGKNNIPKNETLIFCGNHRSYFDPPAIILTNGRRTRFIAKEELKSQFPMGYICWAFDSIYVKRDGKDIGSIKECIKTLKSGKCLGIFPEGTRNGMQKNDGKFKNGTSYLAMKTGAKIIPVGISGNGKFFSKNTVTYGKPIDISNIKGKNKEETEDLINEKIKIEIEKLIDD